MKGQIKIEFVLGVVVFAMIIFYVAAQINNAFLATNVDSKLDVLKARSISLIEALTKNSEIGLALESGNLNKTRIEIWDNESCSELDKYKLGGYRLTISERGEPAPILFCGYVGISSIRTNVIRSIKITNETNGVTNYGNITIEMW